MTSHYLRVPQGPEAEWEYKETDQATGRQKRMTIVVPRHLDINDPQNWTKRWGLKDNEMGEVIVCHAGKGEDSDIVFIGDPTPDMLPVDDEAREITAAFETRWKAKPESMAGDYSQSLIDKFNVEAEAIRSKPAEVPGLADLVGAINKLVETTTVRRV
jgi:hypothetical protein